MPQSTCWIHSIEYADAEPGLQSIYDRVKSPDGQLDNLYKAFSLRPHTILPADDLYLAALHAEANTLPKRFSELLGCYVAILTGCDYALAHHGSNFTHLNKDDAGSERILGHLASDDVGQCGTTQEAAALQYTHKLCMSPQDTTPEDIDDLRRAGWNDGEILEIVQVVAMFSYFTRVINGVGIQLGDEKLGLY